MIVEPCDAVVLIFLKSITDKAISTFRLSKETKRKGWEPFYRRNWQNLLRTGRSF